MVVFEQKTRVVLSGCSTKKILVVDDSPTVRQTVVMTLQRGGYKCVEAVDGLDALSVIKHHKFDLVITDLNMPSLNGFELTKELRSREETKRIPIIILSTESAQDKKDQGKRAGANSWIEKPFKANELLNVISLMLG